MAKYKHVDVSEQQLEDLVRQYVDLIEEGLIYVHHQRITGSGRLDVLLVDSGHSLVLAELKVVEDSQPVLDANARNAQCLPTVTRYGQAAIPN